jgi:hypothetical protein
LLVIEPVAVRVGAAAAHEDTVWAAGRTEADRAIWLLAVLQSSLYVALLEVFAAGLSTLISAHPVPALLALTVPPLTCWSPAAVKLNVCAGPCFPDEYSHW